MRLKEPPAWCLPTKDPATLAWVAHLDVDLELAQAALRKPVSERGWPPGVGTTEALSEPENEPERPRGGLNDYVRPSERPKGPRPESLVAPEGKSLKGAYARRAKENP